MTQLLALLLAASPFAHAQSENCSALVSCQAFCTYTGRDGSVHDELVAVEGATKVKAFNELKRVCGVLDYVSGGALFMINDSGLRSTMPANLNACNY